jgi:MFS family permease
MDAAADGAAGVTLARARLALAFSCLGHAYAHLFQPIFFVVALPLEATWGLSHGEVIALILIGNILYGVAAPLAGWLGDRWSMTGMMVLFFFGTGFGMIATGLTRSPAQMAAALAATGLFAAIYHPVGIAWLVRNAGALGKALGINGVFGGIGPAAAALSAGLLTDHFGWRAAFVVPGALVTLTGLVVLGLAVAGRLVEHKADRIERPSPPQDQVVRTFVVLAGTMLCTSLIYQATQAALPKLFSERIGEGRPPASPGSRRWWRRSTWEPAPAR